MSTFHLRVVAYNKVFFDDEAQSVNVPASDGGYQILASHEECLVAVSPGNVEITDAAGKKIDAVCGNGMMAFHRGENRGELLVDTIELPEEIDIRRAQEAKERAQERMRLKQSIIEHEQSKAALSRAMARLKEASKYKK
ncbi:MAG: FoF1 ATP synthase subunit delta/epsilon [Eubacterium sp.]|jgi:F-type H+-transporting ATPase subunit epsilon|uniref:FoF1 ATP synthase subunit delta/epsilon n=1 Tax=Clostridium sp. (strain SY8519) TaxID=1042156 RepID=UPI0002171CDB|nr:F0F1 ATP synthase subunit epsilon [Clostridium sp. SY8519]BAK47108.1 hypothetical protein CXIVA_11410 [Clostridium sp. SY8519]